MIHALLLDDDSELRALVADYLCRFSMRVTTVASGAKFKCLLPDGVSALIEAFDVLLLDVMLPDANGLDLCRWVRSRSTLPIIMLTAQGDPASRIVGLELGADDCLPKPFEPRELVARIHAVLRRAGPGRVAAPVPGAEQTRTLRFKGWTFDLQCRRLHSPQGVVLALSGAEFRLLSAFVAHPKRALSRERLLHLSRVPGTEVTDSAMDLAVSRLRQKFGDSPLKSALIRTVRGVGYSLEANVESGA